MALVLVLEEDLAGLAKLGSLLVALVLKHEARLEEQLQANQSQVPAMQRVNTYLADVRVRVFQPLLKGRVVARILGERVRRVEDDVHADAVREALEEQAKLAPRLVERPVVLRRLRFLERPGCCCFWYRWSDEITFCGWRLPE